MQPSDWSHRNHVRHPCLGRRTSGVPVAWIFALSLGLYWAASAVASLLLERYLQIAIAVFFVIIAIKAMVSLRHNDLRWYVRRKEKP